MEGEALVDQYLLNGQFQKAAQQLEELAVKYAESNQIELSKECQQKANILKGMDRDHPPEEYYKDDHDLSLSMYSFWDMIDDLVGKIKINFQNRKPELNETQDEEFLLVTKPHTIEDLLEENARLLQTIHQYQERLESLEVAQEENQLLRSSIIQFKQEFVKRKQQNLFQSIKLHKHSKSSFEEEPRIKELENKIRELEAHVQKIETDKIALVLLTNQGS
eukprot:NODE_476_length_7980_cov_0.328258.p2 type:complete len:220 gc:universal NODE_476_length_7980_cov_0.328258:1139-1798(+)